MLKTTNYNLVKIELADSPPDITVLNPNFDTIDAELANRVLKESGKGLSTNDFTTVLLNKLNGIATGANNYTHPSSHPPSIIAQDVNNRFVTDTEKATWNAKASTAVVTTSVNGLMSAADKVKLDGIEAGANNYVHPSSHPASMISQTASYRFVTDTEKSTWNGKANTTVASISANGLMSSTDKSKLDGIAANANNYTHPSAHDASMITQSASYRFVTDTEKSTWNAKASTAIATTAVNGLMSAADKAKLDGIAANATNYSHPSTHPPSIIAQDSSNRFVTDTEKATWNAKASTAVVTTSVNGLMSAADKVKLSGIAAGANNYTHPSTHPASMIVEETNKKFITQAQIAAIDSWTSFQSSGGTMGGAISFPKGITRQIIQNVTLRSKDYLQRSGLSNFGGYPCWSSIIEDPVDDNNTNGLLFMLGSGAGDAYNDNYLRPLKRGYNQKNNIGSTTVPWDDIFLSGASKKYNGYTKLPNGMILQWGEHYAQLTDPAAWSMNLSITFPISFPSQCLQFIPSLQLRYTDGDWATLGASFFQTDMKANGFSAKVSFTGNGNGRQRDYRLIWMAIGF